MTDDRQWPPELEQAAALLGEVPLGDAPRWWRGLAARSRGASDGVRTDWAWVWAAETIASFYPERLLPLLTALRTLPVDRKRRALDSAGERLAIGLVGQPTLAECRVAIDDADETPRRRSVFGTGPASSNVDETLVAFVIDALGCAESLLSRNPPSATGPEPGNSIHDGPGHREVRWVLESETCAVEVDRTESWYPGDVNEPARSSCVVAVSGTRRGGATLTVTARVGEHDLWIDVDAVPEEHDRLLAAFWRTFGRPHRRPEEEYGL